MPRTFGLISDNKIPKKINWNHYGVSSRYVGLIKEALQQKELS